jgi:hypothetical protein
MLSPKRNKTRRHSERSISPRSVDGVSRTSVAGFPKAVVVGSGFLPAISNLSTKLWSTHAAEMQRIAADDAAKVRVIADALRALPEWASNSGRCDRRSSVAAVIVQSLTELVSHVSIVNSPAVPVRDLVRPEEVAVIADQLSRPEQQEGLLNLARATTNATLRRRSSRVDTPPPRIGGPSLTNAPAAVECPVCLSEILPGPVMVCVASRVPHLFHLECYNSIRSIRGLAPCPLCRRTELTQGTLKSGSAPFMSLSRGTQIFVNGGDLQVRGRPEFTTRTVPPVVAVPENRSRVGCAVFSLIAILLLAVLLVSERSIEEKRAKLSEVNIGYILYTMTRFLLYIDTVVVLWQAQHITQ